jgi:hypothetical protein
VGPHLLFRNVQYCTVSVYEILPAIRLFNAVNLVLPNLVKLLGPLQIICNCCCDKNKQELRQVVNSKYKATIVPNTVTVNTATNVDTQIASLRHPIGNICIFYNEK